MPLLLPSPQRGLFGASHFNAWDFHVIARQRYGAAFFRLAATTIPPKSASASSKPKETVVETSGTAGAATMFSEPSSTS